MLFVLLLLPRRLPGPRLLGADVVHELLVLHERLLAEIARAGLARLVRRQDARRVRRG